MKDGFFDRVSKGFNQYFTDQYQDLLIFVLVGCGLLLAAIAVASVRARRRRVPAPNRHLFRMLCRGNGLTFSESRVLKRIAVAYGLPDPVHLFFRRSLFEGGGAAIRLDERKAKTLRAKLYGSAS